MLPVATRTGRLWLRWGLALGALALCLYSASFLLALDGNSHLTVLPIKPLSSTTRVAFLADAGLNKASRLVLEMLRNESVEMVLHSGDLDYTGKSAEFYRLVDRVLGRSFPYFVTMGNYESKRLPGGGRDMAWHAYQKLQRERLGRIDGLTCATVTSRNLACEWRGVSFVTSAIGVNGSRLGQDLQELQAASAGLWGDRPASWRICSWHLPLANFQVGFREGVPWMSANAFLEAYEHCRRFGAMIVNGHEHYYVRSHAIHEFSLANVQFATTTTGNASEAHVDEIALGPGSTLAVVSGLGGHSVSIPSLAKVRELAHLAAVHPLYLAQEREVKGKYFFPAITGDKPVSSSEQINLPAPPKQGYPFGALICDLQVTSRPHAKGECYFKTIAGTVVDRFILTRF